RGRGPSGQRGEVHGRLRRPDAGDRSAAPALGHGRQGAEMSARSATPSSSSPEQALVGRLVVRNERHMKKLIQSLVVIAAILGPSTIGAEQDLAKGGPVLRYCQLISNPETYVGKEIRLRTVYRVGFEWSEFYSCQCVDARSTWVDFSDDVEDC